MDEQSRFNEKELLSEIPFYLNQKTENRFFSMYQEENVDDSKILIFTYGKETVSVLTL